MQITIFVLAQDCQPTLECTFCAEKSALRSTKWLANGVEQDIDYIKIVLCWKKIIHKLKKRNVQTQGKVLPLVGYFQT